MRLAASVRRDVNPNYFETDQGSFVKIYAFIGLNNNIYCIGALTENVRLSFRYDSFITIKINRQPNLLTSMTVVLSVYHICINKIWRQIHILLKKLYCTLSLSVNSSPIL